MQFEIIDHGSNLNIDEIKGQFQNFQNGECKLPYFSTHIFSGSDELLSSLTVRKRIDRYIFYEKKADGWWFSLDSSCVNLSDDFKTTNLYIHNPGHINGVFEFNYLTMLAYKYILIENSAFMIHSAAVIHNDEGILFCGNSGAGKSTQANLWIKYLQAAPLNYDKPCILKDGNEYIVHGSPWSGKEHLKSNAYKRIKAIVFVKQAKGNKAYRLSDAQAFSYMFLNNYVFPLTEETERKYISVIEDAAKSIPVYILECDISENAVKALYEEIYGSEYKPVYDR